MRVASGLQGVLALRFGRVDTGPDPAALGACLDDLGVEHVPLLSNQQNQREHMGRYRPETHRESQPMDPFDWIHLLTNPRYASMVDHRQRRSSPDPPSM